MVDANSKLMTWRMRLADLRGRGAYAGAFDYHQCIFIHVPKTAGTSIARALFDAPVSAVPYLEYERANPSKFRRYFKFCFVRNPWDRLLSAYFHVREHGGWGCEKEEVTRYEDFASFIRYGLTPKNVRAWHHFKPQHYFICDADLK